MRVSLAYVCVERTHEKKWTPNWEKTHRAEKIASIRGEKLHVYCVIILKLMADHTKSAIKMIALHTLHAYKARVLG